MGHTSAFDARCNLHSAAELLRLDELTARWLHDSMLDGWLASQLAAQLVVGAKASDFSWDLKEFTDFRGRDEFCS